MRKDFSHLSDEERLKAENEFLKMKLMLEQRVRPETGADIVLPAEKENRALKNRVGFDQRFDAYKTIKIFDKIGQPDHFRDAQDIPEYEIDQAWEELFQYLYRYDINIDVRSPFITTRELYRFTIEELFEHEIKDIRGMVYGFVYDDFHPDPVYENAKVATEDCINYILQKEPMEWTHHFKNTHLRFNDHYPLTIEELKNMVNRFKNAYDELEAVEIINTGCSIQETICVVNGTYLINVVTGGENYLLSGEWKAIFDREEAALDWYIAGVIIEGIRF